MYCSNCGNKITNGSKFCGQCGLSSGTDNNSVISGPKKKKLFDNDKAFENESQNRPINQKIEGAGKEAYKQIRFPNRPAIKQVENYRSYIRTIIQSKSKRRLFFGCTVAIIGVVALLYESNFIANLISGPRPMAGIALESELMSGNIKDVNINLQLEPDNVYSTGYTYVTKTIDEATNQVQSTSVDNQYYLTVIGHHFLIIEGVPGQKPAENFSGVIMPIQPDLQQKLLTDFSNDPNLKDLRSSILPYMISNKGMVALDDFWLFLFGILLLVFGGYIAVRRILDLEDKKHYIYSNLAIMGYYDIDDFSEDFVQADQAGSMQLGNGQSKLNHKFLFKSTFFYFKAYPLSQMYWAYKKMTQKRVYGIPSGKSYALVLYFKPKKYVEIAETESKVNEHLVLLMSLCPGAKFGYTK